MMFTFAQDERDGVAAENILQAVLPQRRSLVLHVQSYAQTEISSWYDIYVGVTAIWAKCGAVGKGGIAENLGNLFSPT